jgi:hypothetical protein
VLFRSPDSKYITGEFYFKDSAGNPVLSIDSIVLQVKNRLDQDISSMFAMEQITAPGPTLNYWRIKITNNQIYFGTNVATYGSFVFTFTVTHTVPPSTTYTRVLTTETEELRISNAVPVVVIPAVDIIPNYILPTNPLTGGMIDVSGKNGNSSTNYTSFLANLYYSLDPLTPSENYIGKFSVNSSIGDISLLDGNIGQGTYDVRIKIQDATSSSGLVTPGSLSSNRIVRIVVPSITGCASWDAATTVSSPPGATITTYRCYISGIVNVWKYLRPGETIVGSTLALTWYLPLNEPSPFAFLPVNGPGNEVDILPYVGNPAYPIGFGSFGFPIFNFHTYPLNTLDPPRAIRFTGQIITNTGRSIVINTTVGTDFVSNYTPPATGSFASLPSIPWATTSSSCTTTGYIPNTCREWRIYNNSPFPIAWTALHGNTRSIIGGTINSFSSIGSPGMLIGGTQPLVRFGTIQTNRTTGIIPVVGGQITYAFGSTACPV